MSEKFSKSRLSGAAARLLSTSVLLACGVMASTSAHALVTFTFNFDDAAGTGFNDGTSGAARQAAAINAGNLFGAMFATHFDYTANIVMATTATDDPIGTNLASAGSQLQLAVGAPAGFNVNEVIKTKIQTGVDANGAAADGTVNVNFGQPWQLSSSATVTNAQYDFYSTMFHEFTHALGFSSLINQDGTGLFTGNQNWGLFDKFVTNSAGTGVIDSSTFLINGAVWGAASVGGTSPANGLFFNGANAVAAAGGLVGLYSPVVWENGSSGSHLDTDNPVYSGFMMNHATPTGPGARDYSAIEVGMMKDIGYTVTAVPEPSTYALMLAGLGVVGSLARRRRRA